MNYKKENFGDTFLGAVFAIILAFFLFGGEPDIADSVRVWFGKAAGTIPADYIYEINLSKKEE